MKTFGLICMVVALASAQYWTGPYQLTNHTGADVNPSVCKEWVSGNMTCLVWQSYRTECWDIYSRFCNFQNGNGWGPEQAVTSDSVVDNVNPVVAACNDRADHPSFWCVWERRESPVAGSIWASYATFREDWFPPVRVGRYVQTGGDSAAPGVVVIRNNNVDTAWVTWTCHDTDGWHIQYAYHAGDSWFGPWPAVTSASPIRHARLGRGHHGRYYGCPLLVWENGGDIFYTEYVDGSWQTRQEVAHSAALDRRPDIVSYAWYPLELGPWITWESTRDGDTAVYGTAMDTFSTGRRWCDSPGAGNNREPCGTPAAYTVDYWEDAAVAWVTDRNGNPDIYARTFFSGNDEYVDRDPADDINPTVTTLGLTEHWCIWQSDRAGNWDIFGSFIYSTGIEEEPAKDRSTRTKGTIIRGVLFLPSLLSSTYSLLSIDGRKVLDLRPGANDVRHLRPGVYFVRDKGRGAGDAGRARKVILQR